MYLARSFPLIKPASFHLPTEAKTHGDYQGTKLGASGETQSNSIKPLQTRDPIAASGQAQGHCRRSPDLEPIVHQYSAKEATAAASLKQKDSVCSLSYVVGKYDVHDVHAIQVQVQVQVQIQVQVYT